MVRLRCWLLKGNVSGVAAALRPNALEGVVTLCGSRDTQLPFYGACTSSFLGTGLGSLPLRISSTQHGSGVET